MADRKKSRRKPEHIDIISDVGWTVELEPVAQRVPFFFTTGRRIVLLTVFHKQRMNERTEINRARATMARYIDEGHTAEEN